MNELADRPAYRKPCRCGGILGLERYEVLLRGIPIARFPKDWNERGHGDAMPQEAMCYRCELCKKLVIVGVGRD